MEDRIYPVKQDYTWSARVTSFDAGRDRLLRPSSLLRFQQEAGERHLGEAGLTYQEFYRRGMIFVLTRLNVEIHRLPAMGEEVSLLTWHRDGKGAQLYRCYQLLDGRGTVLTEGVSAFALVEVESHRPLRLTVFEQFGIGSQPDRRNGCPDPGRLRPPEGLTDAGERRVFWSDTDYNGHLNNTVYADILCDFVPDGMDGREIAGFSIAYEKEALEGESLSIRTAALPEENGCSTVWMTGEHGRGRCFTANLRLRRTGDAG